MKNIFALSAVALLLLSVASCSQPTKWNDLQRAEFIGLLDDYREMVYLNNLSNNEFIVFTTDISSDLEVAYPVYTKFIVMPALSDTVDMWVVNAIVEDIDADASNMRHLYPYHTLVMQGILPEGLDHASQMSFYSCFAQSVDNTFSSLQAFFLAVITNSIDPNEITTMQNNCASTLFGFPDPAIATSTDKS